MIFSGEVGAQYIAPRLSNANYYGLESYHRLSGRNILRPYFITENQSLMC